MGLQNRTQNQTLRLKITLQVSFSERVHCLLYGDVDAQSTENDILSSFDGWIDIISYINENHTVWTAITDHHCCWVEYDGNGRLQWLSVQLKIQKNFIEYGLFNDYIIVYMDSTAYLLQKNIRNSRLSWTYRNNDLFNISWICQKIKLWEITRNRGEIFVISELKLVIRLLLGIEKTDTVLGFKQDGN